MLDALAQYILFLLEACTVVVAVLTTVALSLGMTQKHKKAHGELTIDNRNQHFKQLKERLQADVSTKEQRKMLKKEEKQLHKQRKAQLKAGGSPTPRLFTLHFQGDVRASALSSLREEINALLLVATSTDTVLITIESGGGMMPHYGLAAAQLQRLRDHHVRLVVAVDKIAASGGYLMASVAHEIIAAPFALIGSIGVVAQLPNFHRFLKEHHIDFEQITAGDHKRTLSLFGENTQQGREKFTEHVQEAHQLFKDYIHQYRPALNIEDVATGEHWSGQHALKLGLVDKLSTSDDYILSLLNSHDVYQIKFQQTPSMSQRLCTHGNKLLEQLNLTLRSKFSL